MEKNNTYLQDQQAWTFTEETIRLLSVSVAQIKGILSDGGDSVSELTNAFVAISAMIYELIEYHEQSDNDDHHFQEKLKQTHQHISHGIVAFQFYDRISQRLDHVSTSLKDLAVVISDQDKRHLSAPWKSLVHSIQGKYKMESERVLFERIMEGETIESALAAYHELVKQREDNANDDIELF